MENCTIVEQLPSPADYNRLRARVGWKTYDEMVIAAALPHSLYCLCALIAGEAIGMARVIGDRGMVFYIQDVIVLPEFQRQGIGTQLMDKIMAYIRQNAHQNTIVGLMSAAGKENFYKKYGFLYRPNEKMGAGMTMFWP